MPSLNPKGFSFTRQNMAVLPPDRRDARQLPICFPRAFEGCFKMLRVWRNGSNHNMDVGRPERLFPVSPDCFRPCLPATFARAAIPCWNCGEKLSSDACGTPKRFQTLKAQRDTHPGIPAGLAGCAAEATTDAQAGASAHVPRCDRRCEKAHTSPHTASAADAELRSEYHRVQEQLQP